MNLWECLKSEEIDGSRAGEGGRRWSVYYANAGWMGFLGRSKLPAVPADRLAGY